MLERALLRWAEDGFDVLADVDDQPARFDAVDRAVDELALATGELVEDLVALDLADPLQHDLLGRLGADPTEDVAIELLGLDHVADLGGGVVDLGIGQGDLGELVLDLGGDASRAVDPDLARLGIDADVDVLVTGDAPIGGLDPVLDGPDQLLAGDLLLGVELEEGTDEVSTHDGLRSLYRVVREPPLKNKTWGSPTSRSGRSVGREVYTRMGGLDHERTGGARDEEARRRPASGSGWRRSPRGSR